MKWINRYSLALISAGFMLSACPLLASETPAPSRHYRWPMSPCPQHWIECCVSMSGPGGEVMRQRWPRFSQRTGSYCKTASRRFGDVRPSKPRIRQKRPAATARTRVRRRRKPRLDHWCVRLRSAGGRRGEIHLDIAPHDGRKVADFFGYG